MKFFDFMEYLVDIAFFLAGLAAVMCLGMAIFEAITEVRLINCFC